MVSNGAWEPLLCFHFLVMAGSVMTGEDALARKAIIRKEGDADTSDTGPALGRSGAEQLSMQVTSDASMAEVHASGVGAGALAFAVDPNGTQEAKVVWTRQGGKGNTGPPGAV